MAQHHLTELEFSALPLDPQLLEALGKLEFHHCTPIQEKALPMLLNHQDVYGQAQTGTGKTLAFLLACAHQLLKADPDSREKNKPRCLILAPTRELALQIHKDATALLQDTPLNLAICYGGKAYEQQKKQFEQPVDILIGTPGRLIDFFKQRLFNFRAIEAMVLDEADRMFDMGFISDVRFLLRRLTKPEERLNMLFSATMGQKVMELAYEHMNQAQFVKIEAESPAADRIEEVMYHPANHEKIPLLIGLLREMKPPRSIIFNNTKHAAIRVWGYLEGNGFPAAIISGDIHQNKREKLLKRFHEGEFAILVATDVASRGLHIPDVTHVFNYDLPELGEDYVHRIGRTARAGASGHAISFACEDYAMNLIDIESYTQRSIPTFSINENWLAELQPPKRMEKSKPRHGGKPGTNKPGANRRRPPRRGKPSGNRPRPGKAKASGNA